MKEKAGHREYDEPGDSEIVTIKSIADLLRAFSEQKMVFNDGFEVVNDADLKPVNDRTKALLRQKKKLHIVILERP